MEKREKFILKAESDFKYLISQLTNAEAEILQEVSDYQSKIENLRQDLEDSLDKKRVLRKKFDDLENADEGSWQELSEDLLECIESVRENPTLNPKLQKWFEETKLTSEENKV